MRWLLVFFVAVAVLNLVAWIAQRIVLSRAAKKIVDNMVRVWVTPHELRKVSLDDYPRLDRERYEVAQRFLEERGFRSIGDYEDLTLSSTNPLMRTPIRCLVDEARGCVAEILEVDATGTPEERTPGLPPRRFCVSFRTELSDGRAIATNNFADIDRLDPPPFLDVAKLPLQATAAELLRLHDERVQRALDASPGVETVPATDYDSVYAQADRQRARTLEFREKIGWLREEEFFRIALASGPQAELMAKKMWPRVRAEIARLPKHVRAT